MYYSKLTKIHLSISCPPLSSVLNAIHWCWPDALSYPGRARRTNKLCVLSPSSRPHRLKNSLFVRKVLDITWSHQCEIWMKKSVPNKHSMGWNIQITFYSHTCECATCTVFYRTAQNTLYSSLPLHSSGVLCSLCCGSLVFTAVVSFTTLNRSSRSLPTNSQWRRFKHSLYLEI